MVVTTAPPPTSGEGNSGGKRAGFLPLRCLHSAWRVQGFCFCSKIEGLQQYCVKYRSAGSNGRGFTNCLSFQSETSSRGLLEEKSKSPLFPMGNRPVVTNDLCITFR